jgi:hypothetical protein
MSGRFDALLPSYNTYSDGSPEQAAANSAYIRYRHVMGGYVEATPEEAAEYDVKYPGWEITSYKAALHKLKDHLKPSLWEQLPVVMTPERQALEDEIKAEIARFEIKLNNAIAKAAAIAASAMDIACSSSDEE